MKEDKRITVRFDDRTWLLLGEIASRTGQKVYTVVRGLVMHSIEQLLDEKGNLHLYEKKEDKA